MNTKLSAVSDKGMYLTCRTCQKDLTWGGQGGFGHRSAIWMISTYECASALAER